MNEIVTVIDIETTGLDATTDHITEIAAIRAEVGPSGYIREIGRFQTYVALPPGVEIPQDVVELTGIRTEDLVDGLDIEYASEALWNFAHGRTEYGRGATLVAHNAPFDLSFLHPFYNSQGFVCTRALSRLVDPDESARLADCCTRYNIPLSGHHRAMNDVEATLQLYAILREKAEVNGITYRNIVIDSEERPLIYTPPGAIVRTITKTKEAV